MFLRFVIFETSMSKKIALCIFRFASMLFLNIWKGGKQKIVLGIFRFASMLFLNIWKGDKQKIVLGIFRFASILSNVIIL